MDKEIRYEIRIGLPPPKYMPQTRSYLITTIETPVTIHIDPDKAFRGEESLGYFIEKARDVLARLPDGCYIDLVDTQTKKIKSRFIKEQGVVKEQAI